MKAPFGNYRQEYINRQQMGLVKSATDNGDILAIEYDNNGQKDYIFEVIYPILENGETYEEWFRRSENPIGSGKKIPGIGTKRLTECPFCGKSLSD